MSAAKESQLVSVSRLGILAGGGDLPRHLIESCHKNNIEVFVVAFKGQTAAETVEGEDHVWARLGASGATIKTLKQNNVSDIVMLGSIRRPSLKELRPDLKTAEFFAKEGLKAMGDDGLLKGLKRFLEKEGFAFHGAQAFMPDLLAPEGQIGKIKAAEEAWQDIHRGVNVLQALGAMDVGQSIAIQQGHVLGIEAAEGTDALIERCAGLKRKGRGPVLIKLSKPEQDEDMDLPTIGPQTIDHLIAAGFAGLAVEAGKSFMHDIETVRRKADKAKIFVTGIDTQNIGGSADE